jgi:hypothetical protein
MNEQHTKSFRAAYDYWFENKPLEEVVQTLKPEETKGEEVVNQEVNEEVKGKTEDKSADKKKGKKDLNEGFDTHVLCSCGSGDLELSKKKTKIRCKECGNVGLTESIVGLKV